jgi:hypothetical protein
MWIGTLKSPVSEITHHFIIAQKIYDEIKATYIQCYEEKS